MVRALFLVLSLCFLNMGNAAPCLQRTQSVLLHLPESLDSSDYITAPAFPGLKFEWPVVIVSPAGEPNRLFVAEKAGHISIITNLAAPSRSIFLDLTDLASHETQEAGLLGLAFHPGYCTNGFLYVFFTTMTNGSMRDCIARFSVDPQNPNKALRSSYTPILFQTDTRANHNAGDLHFGPDGYLYASLGDPRHRNQQLYYLLSGMLRIDVDRKPGNLVPNPGLGVTTNYLVPKDNPFIGVTSLNGNALDPARPVRTEFWAIGLRNPWRFCFDSLTGDLFCGDVGENTWEEVNIIKKGKNYGWGLAEGPSTNAALESPVYSYGRDKGLSIIGGEVYRGMRNPDLYGSYVFGDYGSGRIWALRYTNGAASGVRELCDYPAVTCFGHDPGSGDILLASADMTIRRLVHRQIPSVPHIPSLLSETGAFSDIANLITYPGIEPYDVNIPFWSDNAEKKRWFLVPASEKLGFDSKENWSFPKGTTFVKHFDLETVVGDPSSKRKIETRFLVITDDGAYGLSYAWDQTQTNGFLVPDSGMTREIAIKEDGTNRTQRWLYPSRTQCLICHTRHSGFVLGFNTQQLNRDVSCGNKAVNQLEAMSEAGYFSTAVTNGASLPALASLSDTNKNLEFRARSYLAANCVHCHQGFGWGFGTWDARMDTPLAKTGIINEEFSAHYSTRKVIMPGDPNGSILLNRMKGVNSSRMPPLASSIVDQRGIDLITEWTLSLPRITSEAKTKNNSKSNTR